MSMAKAKSDDITIFKYKTRRFGHIRHYTHIMAPRSPKCGKLFTCAPQKVYSFVVWIIVEERRGNLFNFLQLLAQTPK